MLIPCRAVPICLALLLVTFCGARAEKWRFATPEQSRRPLVESMMTPRADLVSQPPTWQQPPTYQQPPTWQQAPAQPYVASNHADLGDNAHPLADGMNGLNEMNDTNQASDVGASPAESYASRTFYRFRSLFDDVCQDHRNYYRWSNGCGYFYSIAGASLLANTSLDDDFRDWYQDDVRSKDTDNFASFWKVFGEGEYVVPFFVCTAVAGKALERFPVADMVGEHGYRASRAYLVGFPPMLFSQYLLGGSRPNEAPHDSMWRPFEDNNAVSGHAFMGAVPFITAAQMTESKLLKFGFYTLSTFPGWSRVNDDAHYLSQIGLGWYMAYMACSSVNRTSDPNDHFELFPVWEPGGAGIMAVWKR